MVCFLRVEGGSRARLTSYTEHYLASCLYSASALPFLLCYRDTQHSMFFFFGSTGRGKGGGATKTHFYFLPSVLTSEEHIPCFPPFCATTSCSIHSPVTATTHSSRSGPLAARPLLAVSVWGGAGRRWPACSKPHSHWRRPGAFGGPLSWIWHQRRSP